MTSATNKSCHLMPRPGCAVNFAFATKLPIRSRRRLQRVAWVRPLGLSGDTWIFFVRTVPPSQRGQKSWAWQSVRPYMFRSVGGLLMVWDRGFINPYLEHSPYCMKLALAESITYRQCWKRANAILRLDNDPLSPGIMLRKMRRERDKNRLRRARNKQAHLPHWARSTAFLSAHWARNKRRYRQAGARPAMEG